MSGPQLAFALGALVNLAIFAGLLHWHGGIDEDQREEAARLHERCADVTLREQLVADRTADRASGFELALLDETEFKRRSTLAVAPTIRTREDRAS